ncbi:copper binding protein, plastocyanin/azurin family [Cenarchaeum symbiosum A]|uniref:Copper binding protein, plastocyanin/azurin family n=1 Tax=Cenarchaeum symbiosum (strain A) TaxID=414004 RepID=A0RYI9_CENSY|nr:copper binding protein, plastocyanin/azurin family [Cenarchaeum symbiosum A]
MNTLNIGLFFVLSAIVVVAVTAPAAYADHPEATVIMPEDSYLPTCGETNECYIPADVTIDQGGEITWINEDILFHTVTSGTGLGEEDGLFDSSNVEAGESFSRRFPEAPGDYAYFCSVHPWMTGMITVVATDEDHDEDYDGHHDDDRDSERIMDAGSVDGMSTDDMDMGGMDDGMMDGMMDDDHMMADMPEGAATATGMISDGTEVMIWASEPVAGEQMEIMIAFADSEHVNHDIVAMQDGEVVMRDEGAHHHTGVGKHMTDRLASDAPLDIMVTFQGYGIDEITGPVGDEVAFTEVVPEFGVIATMILAVAIVSIIAVTARSRLSFVPRI